MGVFQEQKNLVSNNLPEYILEDCKRYAKGFPDQECCALIIAYDNQLIFKPTKNLHSNPVGFFAIDPVELIEYDVEYVFHSHWNGGSRPSSFDKKSSNELCIPFLIYSLIDDDFYLYENISV